MSAELDKHKQSKILTVIKHREFAIIIGIGGVAALISFIFNNEDIFNYGIAFSSIGLISIGMKNYLKFHKGFRKRLSLNSALRSNLFLHIRRRSTSYKLIVRQWLLLNDDLSQLYYCSRHVFSTLCVPCYTR